MKYDVTMAPLFTSPNSEHRQPLLRHDHGTAPAFHRGKWGEAVEQQGFAMDLPVGKGRPCLPHARPHAAQFVSRGLGQGRQPGLYLATATKQAAESADWRQGAWCAAWF